MEWKIHQITSQETLQQIILNFNSQSGIRIEAIKEKTPLGIFKMYFTEELIHDIVEESKNYFYSKYIISDENARNTIQYDFKKKDITNEDIYKHIAIKILMGIVRLPEERFY